MHMFVRMTIHIILGICQSMFVRMTILIILGFVMHMFARMTIHIILGFRHAHVCTNDYISNAFL